LAAERKDKDQLVERSAAVDSFSLPTLPTSGSGNQFTPNPDKRIVYLWLAVSIILGLVLGSGLGLIFARKGTSAATTSGLQPQNAQALLAGASPPTRPGVAPTAPPKQPAGTNHFAFGLDNAPGNVHYMNDMRGQNGAAFDYRYQYLSGGVNTGHGWETWNSPPGQFATYYIQESASNKYTPVLVYYEMLQSNGSCGSCSEPQKDLSNLDNASLMKAYYANWALLMQKIGATHTTTMVIVEPDLWGFIEQSVVGSSNSAASAPASVASSGYGAVAGLPNTAQGFAWALLHLRDLYAPNAVLAIHASLWGTKFDIGSNTDPNLNVMGLAQSEAKFLFSAGVKGTPAGISHWNLISNDVADHDSGQSGNWWDRNNRTFPNFARYLQFIGALTADSGLRVMVWQVPEGNQYFDTQNNSTGHTQDNRPEYILGHVSDFAHAGIIGVLFGPGNGGTEYDDAAHDGVTNPAPISTYECNQCNNHQSQYADDDGGYLRIFIGQYYKNGAYPLPAS
jgi:hypothetical protein